MNLFPPLNISAPAASSPSSSGTLGSWFPQLSAALRPAGQTVAQPFGGVLGQGLSASVANALASIPIPQQPPPAAAAVKLAPAADLTQGQPPAPGVMPPGASGLIDGSGRQLSTMEMGQGPQLGLLARLGLRPMHVVVGLVVVGGAWYFLVHRKKRGG